MNEKVVFLLSLIVASLVVFILYSNNGILVSPNSGVDCKTYEFNGNDKVNMVLVADKEDAKKYFDFFTTIDPIEQKDFNFYYIDNYKPKCEIYKDTAVLCYSGELLRNIDVCPADVVGVISDDFSSSIRSSTYQKIMSINAKTTKTVLHHEFGHAFVNLDEEYLTNKKPNSEINCKESCSDFDVKDGCYLGCSDNSHFRSIQEGIMRTLQSSNYGLFNEKLITNKIAEIISKRQSSITGGVVKELDCKNNNYYLISGIVEGDNVTIKDVSKETGCTISQDEGDYQYQLVSTDGTSIRGKFKIGSILIEEGTGEQSQEFFIQAPFIDKLEYVQIFKGEEQLSLFLL